jgi:hypothetical protein
MEAAVEERAPLGVLKQPKVLGAWSEVWTCSRAGIVHSNLAGARDIERRAVPKGAMPAVPPPTWKLGFDQPCRSVNRARHMRGDRAKCTLELAVEFRRANGSGLNSVQKFSQVHFSYPSPVGGAGSDDCGEQPLHRARRGRTECLIQMDRLDKLLTDQIILPRQFAVAGKRRRGGSASRPRTTAAELLSPDAPAPRLSRSWPTSFNSLRLEQLR